MAFGGLELKSQLRHHMFRFKEADKSLSSLLQILVRIINWTLKDGGKINSFIVSRAGIENKP